MEVKFHASSEVRPELKPAPVRSNKPTAVESSFGRSDALDQAMASEPALRTEAVAAAEQLLRARQYPPPELVGRISRLLGEHWANATDSF